MEATVYKNENDYYCVSVKVDDEFQDVLETNYQTIAGDLCELINNFNENYQKLNSFIGNLGSIYLSDLISMYFHRIMEICNVLKPRQFYTHLYANFEEEQTINSYDSTSPEGPVDEQYVYLMSFAIQQLVREFPLEDDIEINKLNSVAEATSILNTIFDEKYNEEDTKLKS